MLENFLIEIGLSEKEAKIYLSLLEVDHDSVASLSKRTLINRTTVYPVLEQLMAKKLVQEITIKGKTQYRAESPERLKTFIEEAKIRLDEQSQRVVDVIPQLKGIQRELGERPIVEFREGRSAIVGSIRTLFAEENPNNEPMYLMYPRDLVEDLFTEQELKLGRETRIKRGVSTCSIYTYSKGAYEPDTTADRFRVDEKDHPIVADISIFGDRIRIYTLGESLGILDIKSKDIATTLRTLFKLALEGLINKRDKK